MRYEHELDLAGFAWAIGARGFSFEQPDQLGSALREARGCAEPAVVDLSIDLDAAPASLAHHAAAVREVSAPRIEWTLRPRQPGCSRSGGAGEPGAKLPKN